jgi:peptidoglycan/LPS O-acetylase OafA/YrhL
MGILRVWLAICVVVYHTGETLGYFRPMDGVTAVQCFYMISGFYMALVLEERYQGKTLLFLLNRALRLYPVYMAILVLAAAFYLWRAQDCPPECVLTGTAWGLSKMMPWSTLIWMGLGNLLIEGKDWILFLVVDRQGYLHWDTNAIHAPFPAVAFIFLRQAWSLGAEFSFYLMAPWLVRRHSVTLVLIALASLAIKLGYWGVWQGYDLWSNIYFPAEIWLFLVGVLSYRAYRHLDASLWLERLCQAALAVSVLWVAFYETGKHVLGLWPNFYGLIAAVGLALPAIFKRTKEDVRDRALGEYSYPLYLIHILIYDMTRTLGAGILPWGPISTLLISLPLCWLLLKWVEHPAESWRRAWTARFDRSSVLSS